MTRQDIYDTTETIDLTLSPPPLIRTDNVEYSEDLSSLEAIDALWDLCERIPNRPASGWSSNYELINWLRSNLHQQLLNNSQENNGWGDNTLYTYEYVDHVADQQTYNYGIYPASN